MTMASPGWIYPPVPGVGIFIEKVAAQVKAANRAVKTFFLIFEFIRVSFPSFSTNNNTNILACLKYPFIEKLSRPVLECRSYHITIMATLHLISGFPYKMITVLQINSLYPLILIRYYHSLRINRRQEWMAISRGFLLLWTKQSMYWCSLQ